MIEIDPTDRPRLEAGCRLSESGEHRGVLIVPEGAIRLNGPALKIVEYCDGNRTFAEIVSLLEAQFSAHTSGNIKSDAAELLNQLSQKRIIAFEKASGK